MAQTFDNENQFVVDLLTTLRNERFSPLAWVHFLQRSWEMSCATARDNPSLKRSWTRITLLIGVLALAVLAASFIFEGPQTALRLLPGFLFCVTGDRQTLAHSRRCQQLDMAAWIGGFILAGQIGWRCQHPVLVGSASFPCRDSNGYARWANCAADKDAE